MFKELKMILVHFCFRCEGKGKDNTKDEYLERRKMMIKTNKSSLVYRKHVTNTKHTYHHDHPLEKKYSLRQKNNIFFFFIRSTDNNDNQS